MAAIEALIHAVEDGTLPLKRVEDALARQRRVKERFLRAAAAARRSAASGAARRLLGRDEHQAVAAEMARFAVTIARTHARARALPGDRIAVVAPASPFAARGVRRRRRASCARSGSSPCTTRASSRVTATSPARRSCARRPCMRAWDDPSTSAAIIAARGGYGSVQLLPLLDAGPARAGTPKAFIGYSDNTSLLAWLTTRAAWSRFTGR